MTDLTNEQIVDRCRTYWIASGVDTGTASDMALELRSHLLEAHRAGKPVESVVGDDLQEFAAEWATGSPAIAHATSSQLPRSSSGIGSWGLWGGAIGIVVLVVLVAFLAPDDDSYNQSQWTAVWLIAAGVLAIGEMLTAGFFLLPFAVGAGAAGVLAVVGVGIPFQITVFMIVSVLFLWLLQRVAVKDVHGDLLPVGAARYIGSSALVVDEVNRLLGTGRVKMGTEDWRATTDGDAPIAAGTEVKVVEVRGARLVVEPK